MTKKERVKAGGKSILLLVCLVLLLIAVVGSTVAYIIVKTPDVLNIFKPEDPTGDLIISKNVEHPLGEGYQIPENIQFSFRVSLGADYAGKTLETTAGEMTADANGDVVLTIQPGVSTAIRNLPARKVVTVTEQDILPGFAPEGGAVQQVTIPMRDSVTVTYKNVYTPAAAPVNVTLSGIKILEGRDWQEGDTFTFALEQKSGDTWTELGTSTITYETENAPETEPEGTTPADPESTTATDPEGTTATDPEGTGTTDPEGTTATAPEGATAAAPEGATATDPEETMGTEPAGGNTPADPDFNKFDFTGILENLTFSQVGTYSFRISEKSGNIGGITYDQTVSYFDIVVTDVDMDGVLEISKVTASQNATVTSGNGLYNVAVTIRNTYAPKGSAEVTLNIRKILNDLSGQNKLPEGFVFELKDAEGNVVKTSDPTSAAGETAIKLVFEATQAGQSFDYTLTEVKGDTAGMNYDETVHSIRVDVIDNLDGTISARIYDPAATAEQTDSYTVSFTNTYDPEDTSVQFAGMKYLEGRALAEGEFSFLLYHTGDSFTYDEQTNSNRAGNGEGGGFGFPQITYNKVGTYRYVVVEDPSAALGGITYDDTVFQITVTVTDENGKLVAATAITDQFGKEQKHIVFYNGYEAKPSFLELVARKVLNGGALVKNQFTFELYKADESFTVTGDPILEATNDETGVVKFDKITYEEVGKHYYVLMEHADEFVEGMTYDDSVYGITVEITDDLKGSLVTTYTLAEKTEKVVKDEATGEETTVIEWVPVTNMEFVNTYDAPVPPTTTEPAPPPTTAPSTPDTGDDTDLTMPIILLSVSGAALIGMLIWAVLKKRKKKD